MIGCAFKLLFHRLFTQVNGIDIGRKVISRIETWDRFVTDYELTVLARILGVSIEWLSFESET